MYEATANGIIIWFSNLGKSVLMAGHSKWANIKHRKAATDAKRGKIFTRLIKELTVASRLGGSDRSANPRLRLAIDKAFENNMPKDTVERAIKRGSGELDGAVYEEVRYEGYGISGAAVMVDCLTDNRARTVADVRHVFSKYGGNLGTDGSVSFLFKHCGQFLVSSHASEELVMEAAANLGAEDVSLLDDGSFEIITDPQEYERFKNGLQLAGLETRFSDVIQKPTTETIFEGNDAVTMKKLLDALEGLDDVQEIYTTALINLSS